MQFQRLLKYPEKSFFLLGPRGTGKSTWLKKTFPEAYTVDLLREDLYQQFLAHPELFSMEIRAVAPDRLVIVDEIQRLPNLLNEVHRLIENDARRFILCGSSARKLKRAGVNLLGGRASRLQMHPFIAEELGDAFNLTDAQRYGLIPIVWDSEDRAETLHAYSQLYLKEEIQAEALVRNLPGFARFLPIAAIFHGQVINVSNIARESGVARTTVTGYIQILEETLLTFQLPAYEAKLRVRERKLPKLYWCDPGVVRSMKRSYGDLVTEEKGALFEGLVAQTIRAYKDYNNLCDNFYYWSPSANSQIEVDFLLDIGGEFVAVEVKSGNNFSEKWCKGLRVVSELPNVRRRLIVYPEGPELVTHDGIEILPFKAFSNLLSSKSLL